MVDFIDFLSNYLLIIDKFDRDNYNYLVSIFGKNEVNEALSLILDRENYKDSNLYKKILNFDGHGKEYDYTNVVLMKRLHQIINKLNSIFTSIGDDNDNMFMSDKIKLYLVNCDDTDKLKKVNNLYQEFILLRNRIANSNSKLVMDVALKYYRNNSNDEDFYQCGYLGLLRAIELFDMNKGIDFACYALFWIRGSITRKMYNLKFQVHVPNYVSVDYYRLKKCCDILYNHLRREPTDMEIASYMNVDIDYVHRLKCINDNFCSIYSKCDNGDEDTFNLLDILPDSDNYRNLEDKCIDNTLYMNINTVLGELTSEERDIIKYRYYCDKVYTFKEISEVLGINLSNVHFFHKRALVKLKRRFGTEDNS